MTTDSKTKTYVAPRLRPLGSVHELTQGNLLGGKTPDGLLYIVTTS